MHTPFVAFIPLSNWLRGFDRYGMKYSKALIPESSFPDAFYMLREDEPYTPGLEKARRLVGKLARPNDRVVALRAQLPTGPGAMEPNDVTGTGIGWRWPSAHVALSGVAWVDEGGALLPTRHEEVTAQAYRVDSALLPWRECRPRSFSVLPIARACQASCAFCFSKSSVSDAVRQRQAPLHEQLAWAELARARGAKRAVITGGGEPTLLPAALLLTLVTELSRRFSSTLLITNGSALNAELLQALVDAGLTTLAVSRHGLTLEHDARIMGLVNRVCPADKLHDETYAYALELADFVSPRSIGVIKRQLYDVPFQTLSEATIDANREMPGAFRGDDFREGVASFVEKRAPRFTGS